MYSHIIYFQRFIRISLTEYYFQKSLYAYLLNMSMNEHDNIFCHRKS